TWSRKLRPQLSLPPLVGSGLYTDLKEPATPRKYDFSVSGRNAGTIPRDSTGAYQIDPDGPGPASGFTGPDPNFNFRSLLGNAVLRWEYRPGSAVFLVWQQSRNEEQPFGDF